MIVYKVEDIQNALNLLNEIPVKGLQEMNRMVAVATILDHGTLMKEEPKKEPERPKQAKRPPRCRRRRK